MIVDKENRDGNEVGFHSSGVGNPAHAPQLVMLSVATAGSSGPFGSLKEAFAPAAAIIEAAKSGNELLRGICDREELKAAKSRFAARLRSAATSTHCAVNCSRRQLTKRLLPTPY